jgi:Na+/glutamate symporter
MLTLDTWGTFVAAALTLLLGRQLVQRVGVLRQYSIPEPVAGGLLVTLLLLAAFYTTRAEVVFDTSAATTLMLAFFACEGLNADLVSLRRGGRPLLMMLGVVVGLLCLQNIVGLALASVLGLHPLVGVIAGSVTLSGGHGTGAAWSPVFVCVLFVGVVLRNVLSALGGYQVFERAVSVLGNVSLALFLATALISLRLWELAALALPMVVILLVQTAMMAAYAIFVTFPVMGRGYDAAVIAAGHCGFGLGATPTAIANMQAVTERFGPSRVAFLVVPMVGALFIDLSNALVIKLFVALPFLGR